MGEDFSCNFLLHQEIAKLFLLDDFIIIIYCWLLKIERKSKSSLLRSDYAQLSNVCITFVCTGITVSWALPLILAWLPENMRSKEVICEILVWKCGLCWSFHCLRSHEFHCHARDFKFNVFYTSCDSFNGNFKNSDSRTVTQVRVVKVTKNLARRERARVS